MRLPGILFRLSPFILAIWLSGCTPFEYSPTSLDHGPRALNTSALERLAMAGPGNRIRFAVISDTHAWYDELDDAVNKLNADTSLDFIICAGDVTQFGYAWEWRRFAGLFAGLRKHGLVVIGNHDLQADGLGIYSDLYGPTDFAFAFRGTLFVVFNDNARESDCCVPDFGWLERTLAGAGDSLRICAIAHAAPYSDQLDSVRSSTLAGLFARFKVELAVHAHTHHYAYGQPYGDGVPYLVVESIRERGYSVVEVSDSGFAVERIRF